MEKHSELLSRLVAGRKRDGRCRYDPAAKEELIRSCLKPGASIARLAMQHGVNANLLRTWVAQYQKQHANRQAQAFSPSAHADAPAFVPIEIEMPSAKHLPADNLAATAHMPATVASPPASLVQTEAQKKVFSVRLQVRLPNGVTIDIDDANLDALSPFMLLLGQLPCSDSTTR